MQRKEIWDAFTLGKRTRKLHHFMIVSLEIYRRVIQFEWRQVIKETFRFPLR